MLLKQPEFFAMINRKETGTRLGSAQRQSRLAR